MKLHLNCKQASRMLSQSADGRMRLSERIALRVHLAVCDACANFSKQIDFLRRAMHAYSERTPGPENGPAAADAER